MKSSLLTASVIVAAAAACSSSSAGSASSSGTANLTAQAPGETLTVLTAIAGTTLVPGPTADPAHPNPDRKSGVIDLIDKSVGCSDAMTHTNINIANAHALVLLFSQAGADPSAGTYPINTVGADGRQASAAYLPSDANCVAQLNTIASAISGSITITQVTDSVITGSFEAVFKDGSTKGTFSAPVCFHVMPGEDAGTKTCRPS